MNLFVVGCSPAGVDLQAAALALAALAAELPFFGEEPVESWSSPNGRAAAVCLQHSPERTGGVTYHRFESDRAALFSGRPIAWRDDGSADGRAPLDPGYYLRPVAEWTDSLDGRFAAARVDDEGVDLATDSLGAYPLFEAEVGEARWYSNSAVVLARLVGVDEVNSTGLAGLVGGGWSLEGDPRNATVKRVKRDGERIAPMFGAGFDPDAAAEMLVTSVHALADWPGRPNVVPVTGGRDSRLILAAALAAGFEFEAVTGGRPDDPDFVCARALCEQVGIAHHQLPGNPGGDPYADPARAAPVLGLTTGGTATLADAAGFPLALPDGPLALWHSGQGGEIGRAYYGTAPAADREALVTRLRNAFLARRPGRAELLTANGDATIELSIASFVEAQLDAGVSPEDVPDAFYLHRRMATWAAPTHGAVEFARDTTSPLWSARLLPQLLGLPAADRERDLFHLRVLERLAPELVNLRFADGRPWPSARRAGARRADRALTTTRKAFAAARRRVAPGAANPGGGPGTDEQLATTQQLLRDRLPPDDDPRWDVLDRAAVSKLLERDPRSLDILERYRVWRLASVFLKGV